MTLHLRGLLLMWAPAPVWRCLKGISCRVCAGARARSCQTSHFHRLAAILSGLLVRGSILQAVWGFGGARNLLHGCFSIGAALTSV